MEEGWEGRQARRVREREQVVELADRSRCPLLLQQRRLSKGGEEAHADGVDARFVLRGHASWGISHGCLRHPWPELAQPKPRTSQRLKPHEPVVHLQPIAVTRGCLRQTRGLGLHLPEQALAFRATALHCLQRRKEQHLLLTGVLRQALTDSGGCLLDVLQPPLHPAAWNGRYSSTRAPIVPKPWTAWNTITLSIAKKPKDAPMALVSTLHEEHLPRQVTMDRLQCLDGQGLIRPAVPLPQGSQEDLIYIKARILQRFQREGRRWKLGRARHGHHGPVSSDLQALQARTNFGMAVDIFSPYSRRIIRAIAGMRCADHADDWSPGLTYVQGRARPMGFAREWHLMVGAPASAHRI